MARSLLQQIGTMRDARNAVPEGEFTYIDGCKVTDLIMEEGTVCIQVSIPDTFYYETLSSYVGIPLQNQYQLIQALKDLVVTQTTFNKMKEAWLEVSGKGYGVVTPKEEDIQLEMPELIRHGNKFGVKIKAMAPSVHMIRANIATEIAPIVGNEEQAKDLLSYIEENSSQGTEGILETNIFGKTIKELVDDGIRNKVHKLNEESQMKLQDTIEKVVNDSNGGLVCIII